MTEIISPDWVQAGELGIAFIILILASSLVRYVLKTSGERETRLLVIVEKIAPSLQLIFEKIDDFDERLEAVEKAVGVDTRPRTKKVSRGLVLNDD